MIYGLNALALMMATGGQKWVKSVMWQPPVSTQKATDIYTQETEHIHLGQRVRVI